ncbi:MAG: hypothetical protein ACOYVK_16180 [Bacillota bacterium]
MKKILMKYSRHIAILLGIALLVPMSIFSMNGFGTKAVAQDKSEEERIAAEISNMTGVKVEEILKLRDDKKTWNEIMEMLKNNEGNENQAEKDKRNRLITEMGLREELIRKLADEFSSEEIMEAKLLIERLLFQLQEITEKDEKSVANPSIDVNSVSEEGHIEDYEKLMEKIDPDTAVYLTLKLEKDFGSKEAVLDEYLYALQADLNLENYMKDKDQYLKEKEEKSIGMIQEKIITLAKIEEKMLRKIQQENADNTDPIEMKNDNVLTEEGDIGHDVTVESPLPEIKDVKPLNPADAIMEEINAIDPKASSTN